MISESPKDLFAVDNTVAKSIHGWANEENSFRREHERIKRLYPHDTENHIATT